MKRYKKTKVEYYKDELTHYVCDSCGVKIDENPGCYDLYEQTIEMRTGSVYPDGDCTDTYRADLCEECFTGKLIPFLHSIKIMNIPTDTEIMHSKGNVDVEDEE